MSFLKVLSKVIANIDMPYGYTLSVWSAGALSIYRYGINSPWEVICFLVGAISGFLLPAFFVYPYIEEITITIHVRKAALVNILSIPAALVCMLVVLIVPVSYLGYLLAGFATTLVYIFCFSTLLYFSS